MRAWAPATAATWMPPVARASGLAFGGVLALGVLGSWQQIADLIGSRTLLATMVFTGTAAVAGWLLAAGSGTVRTTSALIAPTRNAGPVFAAVAIAFGNDPQILAAVSGILLIGLAVEFPIASWLGHRRTSAEERAAGEAAARHSSTAELGGVSVRAEPG